jgi:hypothetical protein
MCLLAMTSVLATVSLFLHSTSLLDTFFLVSSFTLSSVPSGFMFCFQERMLSTIPFFLSLVFRVDGCVLRHTCFLLLAGAVSPFLFRSSNTFDPRAVSLISIGLAHFPRESSHFGAVTRELRRLQLP